MKIMTAIALSLLLATNAWAQLSPPMPAAGETYELTKSYDTSEQTSNGSSGSSRGHDTILERVIAARNTGIEFEYDLSNNAKAEDRAAIGSFRRACSSRQMDRCSCSMPAS
jgi:hypothetical protein